MGRNETQYHGLFYMKKELFNIGPISSTIKPDYERGNVALFCGDCLEIMPAFSGSVDAIIADWPYG